MPKLSGAPAKSNFFFSSHLIQSFLLEIILYKSQLSSFFFSLSLSNKIKTGVKVEWVCLPSSYQLDLVVLSIPLLIAGTVDWDSDSATALPPARSLCSGLLWSQMETENRGKGKERKKEISREVT